MEIILSVEKFREYYPEFSNVTDTQLEMILLQAPLYLDNTVMSCVADESKRTILLYMICAHLCYLRFGDNRKRGGTGMVGRISSASEGSVSVSSDLPGGSYTFSWYSQSPYGLDFWQATKSCRGFRYYPGGGFYLG